MNCGGEWVCALGGSGLVHLGEACEEEEWVRAKVRMSVGEMAQGGRVFWGSEGWSMGSQRQEGAWTGIYEWLGT